MAVWDYLHSRIRKTQEKGNLGTWNPQAGMLGPGGSVSSRRRQGSRRNDVWYTDEPGGPLVPRLLHNPPRIRMLRTPHPLPFGQTLLLACGVVASGPAVQAQADDDPERITVTGNVLDEITAEPVEGAIVLVSALDLTLVTDNNGQFVLDQVPQGVYDLNIVHDDYRRLEGNLRVDQPGEFFLAMTVSADPNEGLATGVAGVVTDQVSGAPVPEVVVNVAAQGRVATTSTTGRFTLPDLMPGRYEVTFSHLGYQQRIDSVNIEVGRVSVVDVALSVEAIELDPIDVSVERQDVTLQGVGFYERESDGWGDFVDQEELERWSPVDLSDALVRFPGVRVVSDPSMPSRRFVLFRRAGEECYPAVYIDGTLVDRGGDTPAALDDLVAPVAVAGVEIYKGQAGLPPQYWGMNSSCGVVLIWIRKAK